MKRLALLSGFSFLFLFGTKVKDVTPEVNITAKQDTLRYMRALNDYKYSLRQKKFHLIVTELSRVKSIKPKKDTVYMQKRGLFYRIFHNNKAKQ